jgi:hypothetical protein
VIALILRKAITGQIGYAIQARNFAATFWPQLFRGAVASTVADQRQEKIDDQLQVVRRSVDLVDGVRHAGICAGGDEPP